MFLVGALLRFGFVTAWLFHLVACMGCCLGCDAKHKLTKSQTQSLIPPMSKPCMSRFDMNDTPDPSLDSHETGNTSNGFINHGFLLWNQSRQQWIGNKRNYPKQQPRKPTLSRNATYENLLGSNKPFTKPVPLSEMVDFLVDVWEQEGLYD